MNAPPRRIASEMFVQPPSAGHLETELAMGSGPSDATFREMGIEPLSPRTDKRKQSLGARIPRGLGRAFQGNRTTLPDVAPLRFAEVGRTASELGLATPAQLAEAELKADANRREGRREGLGVALSQTCRLSPRQTASLLARHLKGYHVSTDSALLGSRLRSVIDDQRQSILICGLRHWDEADIVAAGAGVALALIAAWQIAIVDCNFCRPSIHQLFGFDQTPGTHSVMSGAARLEAAICNTGVADLAVLPTEQLEVAPSIEFSEEARLGRILKPLENRKAVIFCAPPLLECPETLMLAARLDNTLLVTTANVGRAADLADAEQMLGSVGAKALGVVLARNSGS
jgi:Mrp family chromosome partitioning ATPase